MKASQTKKMALGPKGNKQKVLWGLKMVKDNVLQLVNKGPVMTFTGMQVGHSCPLRAFSNSNLHDSRCVQKD